MPSPPGRKNPDDDDYVVQQLDALQTSDLAGELSGTSEARPNLTVQLDTLDIVEVRPGISTSQVEPSIVIEPEAPQLSPSPIVPAKIEAAPVRAKMPTAPASNGPALVVVVYVIATAALGWSIYERFFS